MMTRKAGQAKLRFKELFVMLDKADFVKTPPTKQSKGRGKRTSKRNKNNNIPKETIDEGQSPPKKKMVVDTEASKMLTKRFLDVMRHQQNTRKEANEIILAKLVEIIHTMENERHAIANGETRLRYVVGGYVRSLDDALDTFTGKINALEYVYNIIKIQSEDIEIENKAEVDKLVEEIEADINNMQQNLISKTKKSVLENLYAAVVHAMEND